MKVNQSKIVAMMAFLCIIAVVSFSYFLSFSRVEPYWGEHPGLKYFNTIVIDVSVEESISQEVDYQDLRDQALNVTRTIFAKRHGHHKVNFIKGFSEDVAEKHPLAIFIFYKVSTAEKGLILKADIKRSELYKLYESSLRHPDVEKEFANMSREKFKSLAKELYPVNFSSEGKFFSSSQVLIKKFALDVQNGLAPYVDVMEPEEVNVLNFEKKMHHLD